MSSNARSAVKRSGSQARFRLAIQCLWILGLLFQCGIVSAQYEGRTITGGSLNTGQLTDTITIQQSIQYARSIQDTAGDKALLMLKETLNSSRARNYADGIVRSLLALGKIYVQKADFDQAILLWQEGIDMLNSGLGDKRLLAQFYNNMGVVYNIKGMYSESLAILSQGLDQAQAYPENDPAISATYNNIAMVYLKMPNTAAATKIYYLEKAALHARKAKDNKMLSGALMNLGKIYIEQEDWQKGKQLLDSVLSIAVKEQLVETQYSLLLSLGNLYLSKQKPQAALQYFERMYALGENGVNPYYRMLGDLAMGEAHAQLKNYSRALAYMKSAEKASGTAGTTSNQAKIYESLSLLYTDAKEYKEALLYYKKYTAINDSLLQQNSVNYIAEMDIRYKSVQKENEIARSRMVISEQSNRIARNNLFIVLAVAGIVVLALFLLFTIRHAQQGRKILLREKSIDNLKSMIAGEEKERVRISQELHDGIGGMLAAMKFQFNGLSKEVPKASKEKLAILKSILETASGEVRAVAHRLAPDVVTRFGLIKALEMHCALHATAQFSVNLQFHGDLAILNASYELMIYRIVQELLQNTLKHAKASYVDIQVMEYDQQINLTFEDNGQGFNMDKVSSGLGLSHIRSRIASLQGSMSLVAGADKGTTIHLSFPINTSI